MISSLKRLRNLPLSNKQESDSNHMSNESGYEEPDGHEMESLVLRWKAVTVLQTRQINVATSSCNKKTSDGDRMFIDSNISTQGSIIELGNTPKNIEEPSLRDTFDKVSDSGSISDTDHDTSIKEDFSDIGDEYFSNELHDNSRYSNHSNTDSNENTDCEKLYCETEKGNNSSFSVTGRRIINISYFFSQLKLLQHKGYDCSFFDLNLISEKIEGLQSIFSFQCAVCNIIQTVKSDDPSEKHSSNLLAVLGALSTGIGYSQFSEVLAAMNIPSLSHKTYTKYHNQLSGTINNKNKELLINAGKEEALLAIQSGNVTSDGVPTVLVFTAASLAAPDVSHLSGGYSYNLPSHGAGLKPSGSYLPAGGSHGSSLGGSHGQGSGVSYFPTINFEGSETATSVKEISGSYLPGVGSHGQGTSGSASSNNFGFFEGAGDFDGLRGFGNQEDEVFFYGDDNNHATRLKINVGSAPSNRRVIFVKSPDSGSVVIPEIISPSVPSQDRTVVYVLSRKQQPIGSITIPSGLIYNAAKSKPEVYQIKYSNLQDAEKAVADTLSGHVAAANIKAQSSKESFVKTLAGSQVAGISGSIIGSGSLHGQGGSFGQLSGSSIQGHGSGGSEHEHDNNGSGSSPGGKYGKPGASGPY
ncbi:hypothetical protein RN001_010031 [Aquatica leii]|uniref:DUF243 domain-containing protein n=1 Tax=Aquatica leii TaxID=1421715 RepID=A0AAN7P0C0_9COLE|nr:hypothetical protein RN001_010031 [Aquatica leii]